MIRYKSTIHSERSTRELDLTRVSPTEMRIFNCESSRSFLVADSPSMGLISLCVVEVQLRQKGQFPFKG